MGMSKFCPLLGTAHVLGGPHDFEARRITRHQKDRRPLVYGHVWIRDRHHQQELRVLRIRRVEFLAVQYPALAVANGPRPELAWIRATLRLGHGEAREGF